MWVILLLISFICTAGVGAQVTVTGHRGEKVDIKCSYESGYETNVKYFCKGEWKRLFKDIMVESGSPAKDERFNLTDDTTNRVFTVTITDLRTEDEGQYWCAVRRTIPDVYSEVLLRIEDKVTSEVATMGRFSISPSHSTTTEMNPQSSSVTDHHGSREKTVSGSSTVQRHQPNTNLASIGLGLVSVLLVLILCSGTFFILKKRNRKSGTALLQQNMQHNMEIDCMYEEIPNSDITSAVSSSNQTPASHLNSLSEVSTVYATVTNQQPNPSANQKAPSHPDVSIVYATVTNHQPDSNLGHSHSANQVPDTGSDYYGNIMSPKQTLDNETDQIDLTGTHQQNMLTDESVTYSMIENKNKKGLLEIT